jgi:hypothetical protein
MNTMPGLLVLDLSSNCLIFIPDEWRHFQRLQILDLYSNR